MNFRGCTIALLMVGSLTPPAIAQSGMNAAANEQYVPRLGDIMNAAQSQHMKLWFAGKSLNWELAFYELRQLKASLVEAASLYSGIPVTNVATMTTPVQSIAASIEARDGRRFAKAVGELTDGCNACHRSMGWGFIVMRVPAVSPFSNQSFPPQGKQ
jgi:hypothetical protein